MVSKRITSLTYHGDTQVQYTDETNLAATLLDLSEGTPGVGIPGQTIRFTVGSQWVESKTDEKGIAKTSLKISQLPANSSIETSFKGDDSYVTSTEKVSYVIDPETACGNYNGTVYANTAGPKVMTAEITLSVVVNQEDDGNTIDPDPSNMGFKFNLSSIDNYGSVSLVGDPEFDANTSTISQVAKVTLKTGNLFTNLDLSWTISSGFSNVSCPDQRWILTVAIPTTDFAAGGGHIILDENSGGLKNGLEGTKNNFGFGIRWSKNFTKPTGSFNTIWRQADKSYQARSNSASALIITKDSQGNNIAQITYTNVNMRELDCVTDCWSDGNGKVILTVYDLGEPGSNLSLNNDKIGIAVLDKTGRLIYSSNHFDPATNDKVKVRDLAGGNIQVKPAGTPTKSAEMQASIADVEPIRMTVYPNPFADRLKLEFFSGEDTNARIVMYDMTGKMVQVLFDQPVSAGENYTVEFKPVSTATTVYLYRATIGESQFSGKVIYKR